MGYHQGFLDNYELYGAETTPNPSNCIDNEMAEHDTREQWSTDASSDSESMYDTSDSGTDTHGTDVHILYVLHYH